MNIMFLGKKMTWYRLRNMWVIYNMYQGRGGGLINQLNFQPYLLLGASVKILVPSLPSWMYIPLMLCWLVGTTTLGVIDRKKLGLWQLEKERTFTFVNPVFKRLERRMMRIENKLGIDQGEDKDVKYK